MSRNLGSDMTYLILYILLYKQGYVLRIYNERLYAVPDYKRGLWMPYRESDA